MIKEILEKPSLRVSFRKCLPEKYLIETNEYILIAVTPTTEHDTEKESAYARKINIASEELGKAVLMNKDM